MNPKSIAGLITEDPDVPENKIRCRICRQYYDASEACQHRTYPFDASDFDWDQFYKDLEAEERNLTLDDISERENYIIRTIKLNSKYPIRSPLLNRHYNRDKWVEDCPEFEKELADKIKAIKGYWEIEEQTAPQGYHGTFKYIRITANLNRAEFYDIEDMEIDDDGFITLHISIQVPYHSTGWQSDSLA